MRRASAVIGLVAALTVMAASPSALTASPLPEGQMGWRVVAPTAWAGDRTQPVAFLNVATDDSGGVLVANFSSILRFDAATGAPLGAIADPSGTVVQYDDVEAEVDGTVWVADSKSFGVYLLDAAGAVLVAIPPTTPDNADPTLAPNELDLGPDGNVYVMYSSAGSMIQVFTPDGHFVRSFTLGDNTFSSGLNDLAIGPDGNVYVAGSASIRVFGPDGAVVVDSLLPAFTAGLHGIAVGASGEVYVGGTEVGADGSLAGAVYEFDQSGQPVAQFGRAQQRPDWGNEMQPGELGFTVQLAVTPDGHLVISDLNGGFSQLLQVAMPG